MESKTCKYSDVCPVYNEEDCCKMPDEECIKLLLDEYYRLDERLGKMED